MSLVKAFSIRQHVDQIKALEKLRRRLMDGADYGATLLRQLLQQRNHLPARERVQATAITSENVNKSHQSACEAFVHLRRRFIEPQNRWVVYQLERNRETLLLSPRQPLGDGELMIVKSQSSQNILNLLMLEVMAMPTINISKINKFLIKHE